ncbi:YbaB/EbfC family nucleoid-associated protein [Streptomyces mayonensis]|uniref:YbaB/EbfC family nucleoid-associated protein n=1 Tax=Streptomyces mayonensis TaxID=2750816 RepID=UPI0020A6C0AF|nr:YbaB/EbfC family nucleoid-associated protein [Streptomyces sp. A108]
MAGQTEEPMQDRMAKARAHLEETQAAIARVEQDLMATSETVRSRDRVVEVTVGPQGELTGLAFPDNKFAGMAGPQLAASVLEAAAEGRRRIAERVMDAFEPLTQPNPHVPGRPGVEIDWERIFGSALSGGQRAGGRNSNRLRDEIHEDDTDPAGGGRA